MQFSDLQIHADLVRRLEELGFNEPTPVQRETFPLSLSKKDLIACAKTGSGKTLAFLVPLYHHLLESQEEQGEKPRALILSPTRELAIQIGEEAEKITPSPQLKTATIYGGVDYDKQRKVLAENPALIVATPGRLIDYVKSGEIDLSGVEYIVLDEADRMLDMGFVDDVKSILARVESKKQFSLFSATIDYSALYSVWEYMDEPEEMFINPELIDHENIAQGVIHLSRDEKLPYLIQYLEQNQLEPVIVFTNSKRFVETIVDNLNYHNVPAQGLSSTVNQKKRQKVLAEFRDGQFRVLVATDVASRGIHVDDIKLVVNYDIPQDPESYVHRIGRTARAGKTGEAASFCSELDYESLERLERYLKYKLPVRDPEERYIENIDFVRIKHVPSEDRDRRSDRSRKRTSDRKDNNKRKKEKATVASRPDTKKPQGPKRRSAHHHGKVHKKQPEIPQVGRDKKRPVSGGEPVVVARRLDVAKPKGIFQKILSFFSGGKKKEAPQISSKTMALLEREARGEGRGGKSYDRGRRKRKPRERSGKRHK